MARNKGMFEFAANFEVKAAEALDPRVVVETKSDLINKETWPYDGNTLYLYNGLLVGVADEGNVYMLIDSTKALEPDYSGWKRTGGGDKPATITIVGNSKQATFSMVLEDIVVEYIGGSMIGEFSEL